MKNWIINQYHQLCAIDSSAELYRIFFRGLQAILAIALGFQLLVFLPALFRFGFLSGEMMPSYLFATVLLIPIAEFAVAEYALRAIQKKQFRGTAIGLMLASFMMPSYLIPFGLFGFYCFLNKQYQETNIVNAPKPFLELLSTVNLNFTKSESNSAA